MPSQVRVNVVAEGSRGLNRARESAQVTMGVEQKRNEKCRTTDLRSNGVTLGVERWHKVGGRSPS